MERETRLEPAAPILSEDDSIPKELPAFANAGGQILLRTHCSGKAGIALGCLKPGARIGKDRDTAKAVLVTRALLDCRCGRECARPTWA